MENQTGKQTTTLSGTFEGFTPPTRNYFMMPNEWTDITAEIDSLAELKVVEYVLRHTWGFHEFGICKTISIDEFMNGRKYTKGSRKGERMDKGTKLSRPSVIDGLKRAVEHGYLICIIDNTDQARITKSYALKMSDDVKILNTSKVSLPPNQSRNFTPPVKNLNQRSRSASQEALPRSEKETIERHSKKERETQPQISTTSSQPNSLSLSPVKSSLLDKLTDEQADFWTRWCAIARSPELNETAYTHVVSLTTEITSTADLQSLYDFEYDRLREFAKTKGNGEPLPPRLGNLIKALPEWRQTQVRRKQEKTQDQEAHEHIPGSGSITNWTQARLAGNQPAINYDPLPPVKKIPKDLKKVDNVTSMLSAEMQERIRQAREKRQTELS
jgi:hypothetical protein